MSLIRSRIIGNAAKTDRWSKERGQERSRRRTRKEEAVIVIDKSSKCHRGRSCCTYKSAGEFAIIFHLCSILAATAILLRSSFKSRYEQCLTNYYSQLHHYVIINDSRVITLLSKLARICRVSKRQTGFRYVIFSLHQIPVISAAPCHQLRPT